MVTLWGISREHDFPILNLEYLCFLLQRLQPIGLINKRAHEFHTSEIRVAKRRSCRHECEAENTGICEVRSCQVCATKIYQAQVCINELRTRSIRNVERSEA